MPTLAPPAVVPDSPAVDRPADFFTGPERQSKSRQHKAASLYWWILACWGMLLVPAVVTMVPTIVDAFGANVGTGLMACFNAAFIAYFWLNGTKDVAYTMLYHCWLKKNFRLPPIVSLFRPPKIALVYCTYNDFNGESLLACMDQKYRNFVTVILDDSRKPEYIEMVDNFAALHKNVRVVRRDDREGFKAGNLNHFLMDALKGEGIEYFAILDSDEIIPRTFCRRMMDYFLWEEYNGHVGIVQANHIATRNRNWFMRKFAPGVDAHWPAYQSVKDRFGFLSLLGHGAMVKADCYYAAGGFPHVVAEDLNFSLAARAAGYLTVFAPDVVCEEEYPINYVAFQVRHGKWTGGNLEFIKKNTHKILSPRSGLRWFEVLDIILFTYSLPLTAFFFLYVIMNVFIFPLLGFTFMYPPWMIIPTLLFLVAPMLNDIISLWRKMKKRELLSYLFYSILLYGSMLPVSFFASIAAQIKGSVFTVTPKDASNMSIWQAYVYSWDKILFSTVLVVPTQLLNGNILPVLLIIAPSLLSPCLAVSSKNE